MAQNIVLTKEENYFLRTIADHLNDNPTMEETVDWSILLKLAEAHQVKGIVFKQSKNFIPTDYKDVFSVGYSSELYYYTNRKELMKSIAEEYERNGIEFFTVKGFNVAEKYPIPALRTMGDCDIIVHSSDKDKAHNTMLSMGFDNVHQGGYEWTYFQSGFEFEIHDQLLNDNIVNSQISRDFMNTVWNYVSGDTFQKQLDWNVHFLFLLLHLKKHLLSSGVGLRQFMDIAVIMQKCSLDWHWIIEKLDELGLHRFFDVCCSLLNRWFDISIPVSYTDIKDDFFISSTKFILINGVFGFDNEKENLENIQLNHLLYQSGPLWCKKIRYIIFSIFPSYESVRYVKYYSFVNERPWLLPVAWFYRFYRAIRYRMTDSEKQMMGNVLTSSDKLISRQAMLKNWGL